MNSKRKGTKVFTSIPFPTVTFLIAKHLQPFAEDVASVQDTY